MNVVIIGAGTVGTSLAEVLCAHQQDVCIVDSDSDALHRIEEKLDVQTVNGSGCNAITLFQAGILNAELCLAVTSHDEINFVGASIAKSMGVRRSIARVYDPGYLDNSTFDYPRHFKIDRLISLEYLTALEIAKAIRIPGLFEVESFARGGIEVQEIAVEAKTKAAGIPLKDLALPAEVLVGLISNERSAVIPGANDELTPGDHVTLIGKRDHLNEVKKLFAVRSPRRLNVIIAGGGEIGFSLARILNHDHYHIVIMETDLARCEVLSEKLPHATVLHADATLKAELEEARVGSADVFVAATGRDADNIVCSLEAKDFGCGSVVSIVRRPDYANVLGKVGIDHAVSPREVMEEMILGYIQTGPILSKVPIAGGAAEAWEVEIKKGAPITEATLRSLAIRNCLIAALDRENDSRVPRADDQLRAGDTAIVLVQEKNAVEARDWFIPVEGS